MALTGNGSTFSFGGAVATVQDMEYSTKCAPIEITTLGSAVKLYEPGLPERSVSVTVVGQSAITIGQVAVLTCTFQGYSAIPSGSLKFICTENTPSFGVDNAITSSLKFKQTTQ